MAQARATVLPDAGLAVPAGARGAEPRVGALVAILVLLASLAGLVWIGDAPWIADEPLLLSNAFAANVSGTWVDHGLMGTRGLPYGPLPTWIYQLLLRLTHDPIVLLVLRVVLCQGLTVCGLLWLGRLLPLPRWFLVTVPLSPYLWMFGRLAWDNSFAIPVTALLLPAYLALRRDGSRLALAVSLLCLGLLPLIHLMSLAVVVPVATIFVLVERRTLLRHWPVVAGVAILLALPSALYLRYLYLACVGPAVGAPVRAAAMFRPQLDGLVFPFLGGGWFTALGFGERFGGPPWLAAQPWAWRAVGGATGLALPLAWLGIWRSARKTWSCLRAARQRGGLHGVVAEQTPIETIQVVCVAVLVGQMVIGAVTGTHGAAHYFNSTWMVHGIFIWLGFDRVVQRLPRLRWWVAVQACALLVFLAGFAWSMHTLRGTRWLHHGPTIANQIAIARALAALPPASGLLIEARHGQLLQNSVMTLAELLALQIPPLRQAVTPADSSTMVPPWFAIRYARGAPPYAAHLVLERLR